MCMEFVSLMARRMDMNRVRAFINAKLLSSSMISIWTALDVRQLKSTTPLFECASPSRVLHANVPQTKNVDSDINRRWRSNSVCCHPFMHHRVDNLLGSYNPGNYEIVWHLLWTFFFGIVPSHEISWLVRRQHTISCQWWFRVFGLWVTEID